MLLLHCKTGEEGVRDRQVAVNFVWAICIPLCKCVHAGGLEARGLTGSRPLPVVNAIIKWIVLCVGQCVCTFVLESQIPPALRVRTCF